MADDLRGQVLSAIQDAGASDATGDDFGEGDTGAVGEGVGGGEAVSASGDTGGDTAGEGQGAAEGSGEKPTKAEVADKLAAELKIDPKRNNRIPYARVQQIVANKEKAILSEVAKHFKLDEKAAAALKFEELGGLFETHHSKRVTELDGLTKQQKAYIDEMEGVRWLMENEPEKFLSNLQLTYPHFKQYLTPKEQKQVEQAQAQQQQRIAAKPEPDVALPDGTRTYSVEGYERYMEWREQQIADRYEQKLEALRGEYKPLIEQQKSHAIAQQTNAKIANMVDGYRQNWPGFTEHEAEILQLFQSDKRLTLPDAYNRVVMGKTQAQLKEMQEKLAAAEKTTREKVMAELKAAKPVDTGVTGGAAVKEGETESLRSKVLAAMKARAK